MSDPQPEYIEKRMWRTLIRVSRVYPDEVRVIIPGWDHRQDVGLPHSAFPKTVSVGDRLHARVNIDARFPQQLVFEDWEKD